MPPPISNPSQAGGACLPLQKMRPENARIKDGVDSHRIRFQLQYEPKLNEVQTVVGASSEENPRVSDAIEKLKPRLLELYKNGSSLVSFGSSRSFDRMQNMRNQPIRANSSSLIEQILAATTGSQLNEIRLSDQVTLKSISDITQTEFNKLKFYSGKIVFQQRGEPDREIEFREFCPDYDGHSLSSETLLAALKQVPETNASSFAPGVKTNITNPQFYSAKGIGRSASLAVLHSFKELCMQKNGFDTNEVSHHLSILINQGRTQRHGHFVNSKTQEKELLKACDQINAEVLKAKTTTESADHASVNNSVPEASTAAAASPLRKAASIQKTTTPTPITPSTPLTAPASTSVTSQPARRVNKTIQDLTEDKPNIGGVLNSLPYMPIKVDGIAKLANKQELTFPVLSVADAKKFATDIFKAGFYGDALGAELERSIYEERKNFLLANAGWPNEEIFNDCVPDPSQRNKIFFTLLKKNHNYPVSTAHRATDDTQQGALSAIAKMSWLKNGKSDLNELAIHTLTAFRTPNFPNMNRKPGEEPTKNFDIRGGATTIHMCQAEWREGRAWKDMAIQDIGYDRQSKSGYDKGNRANAAGNGGMMRIGYDLLPLLASGATTQDLVEQVLISNQVTHPSSFSAVACVGQALLMAKCINWRLSAEKDPNHKIPKNFFIDTYHEVAEALQHCTQKFNLLKDFSYVPKEAAHKYSPEEWRTERFPSEFLKCSSSSTEVVNAGSVEQALADAETQKIGNSSAEIDSILKRWSSSAYLGATFPSVVFLLEKFGYNDPALAVNMAALVTKDSDTCATIIAQVMGALHGSKWVDDERKSCIDINGRSTFNEDLGGEFKLDDLIAHTHSFYDERGYQQKNQRTT